MADIIFTPVCEVCEGELAQVPKSSPYNNFLNVTTTTVLKTRKFKRIVGLSCGHVGHEICMTEFFSNPDRDLTRTRKCPTPNCYERHPVNPDLQNLQLNFKPSKILNDTQKEFQKKIVAAEFEKITAETGRDIAESCRADAECQLLKVMEENETKYDEYEAKIRKLREELEDMKLKFEASNQRGRAQLNDLTNSLFPR